MARRGRPMRWAWICCLIRSRANEWELIRIYPRIASVRVIKSIKSNMFRLLQYYQLNFCLKTKFVMIGWCLYSRAEIFRGDSCSWTNRTSLSFFRKNKLQGQKASLFIILKKLWQEKHWKYLSVGMLFPRIWNVVKLSEAWVNYTLIWEFTQTNARSNAYFAKCSLHKKVISINILVWFTLSKISMNKMTDRFFPSFLLRIDIMRIY